MPTNEERHEVAQRLRDMKPWTTPDNCFMLDAIDECIFGKRNNTDFNVILDRLADLIKPEPKQMCYRVWHGEELVCSECERRIADSHYHYCPNCGAKVAVWSI